MCRIRIAAVAVSTSGAAGKAIGRDKMRKSTLKIGSWLMLSFGAMLSANVIAAGTAANVRADIANGALGADRADLQPGQYRPAAR